VSVEVKRRGGSRTRARSIKRSPCTVGPGWASGRGGKLPFRAVECSAAELPAAYGGWGGI